MENYYYAGEKNIQMLLYLLKAQGIKRVIASPGATNASFVASMQQDPFFDIYSCVDERSAAYMACGMAEESGEPVILSCTGATASRNYLPGLTEAFYRKLPILVITSSLPGNRKGHLFAQFTDRSCPPPDCVKSSFNAHCIKDDEDYWSCNVILNEAILELTHGFPGPVHINLETRFSMDLSKKTLPQTRIIERIGVNDKAPALPKGKIAIFIGQHKLMTQEETTAIDAFCAAHDAVVLADHTSNYKGRYCVLPALIAAQENSFSELMKFDVLIHIGEVSGEYYSLGRLNPTQVWRVSPDGRIRDRFKRLRYVFEMDETCFFKKYSEGGDKCISCFDEWSSLHSSLLYKVPDLPLSTLWLAKTLSSNIPSGSVLYLSILNVLRSWNFFPIDKSINVVSNVGAFGIDGMSSSLIGASQVNKQRLYFGMTGDLNFFYDLNSLGNRHLGANIRLLLVNNGHGQEFRTYKHAVSVLGDDADPFIAAAGHFGNQSPQLVKSYAENLGFRYLSARTKEEVLTILPEFCSDKIGDKPIIVEVFTNNDDEYESLKLLQNIAKKTNEQKLMETIHIVGRKGKKLIKEVLK